MGLDWNDRATRALEGLFFFAFERDGYITVELARLH